MTIHLDEERPCAYRFDPSNIFLDVVQAPDEICLLYLLADTPKSTRAVSAVSYYAYNDTWLSIEKTLNTQASPSDESVSLPALLEVEKQNLVTMEQEDESIRPEYIPKRRWKRFNPTAKSAMVDITNLHGPSIAQRVWKRLDKTVSSGRPQFAPETIEQEANRLAFIKSNFSDNNIGNLMEALMGRCYNQNKWNFAISVNRWTFRWSQNLPTDTPPSDEEHSKHVFWARDSSAWCDKGPCWDNPANPQASKEGYDLFEAMKDQSKWSRLLKALIQAYGIDECYMCNLD